MEERGKGGSAGSNNYKKWKKKIHFRGLWESAVEFPKTYTCVIKI